MSNPFSRPAKRVQVQDFQVGPELALQIRHVFMKPPVSDPEQVSSSEQFYNRVNGPTGGNSSDPTSPSEAS